MPTALRSALFASGLAVVTPLCASTELTQLRSGLGVTGAPQQLSGTLDTNGNGRHELLVAGRWHFSIVEEDTNPRGYRELARVHARGLFAQFKSAMLVEAPGTAPALLVQWDDQLELRDPATLRITARSGRRSSIPSLGDVDGDGLTELVVSDGWTVDLLDPSTLVSRGSLTLAADHLVAADIVGDARAELITTDGRAYSVTRSGNALSAAEVWNAAISGTWIPYAIPIDGHQALVLHDAFGFSAQLATFQPAPSLRTLVPADGPSFTPRFADANGDGRVDLITSDTRNVRAIDIASGATLWQRDTIYELPYIGSVHSPVTTDLDGDGIIEMAWADKSYDSGVVAISAPLAGAPRWHADWYQSFVVDTTLLRRADGSAALAYLTQPTQTAPRLSTLGFLDAQTLADAGGSALAWLPGYTGLGSTTQQQHAIAALARDGQADALVVAGAEYPLFSGTPLARWLWTFDDSGVLLSSRTIAASIDSYRVVAAQVLARPERQLVLAGWLPPGSTSTQAARVEVIDYASGNLLWQSALLPSYDGGTMLTKVDVADLDADGQPEIVVAYGGAVTVLRPASGTAVVATHTGQTFSVLDRGAARTAKLATLNRTDVALYDGLAAVPEKTFVLPYASPAIALFAQAPDDMPMFVTAGGIGLTVRRYADGQVVAASGAPMQTNTGWTSLTATDLDGDQRIDIIGSDPSFEVWRLDNDYVFRNGFD